MNINKSKLGKVYSSLIGIVSLSLMSQLLPDYIPYDYFTNESLEPNFLSLINFTFRKFIFSIPIFMTMVGFMVHLFYRQKFAFLLSFIIIQYPLKAIFEGIFLIQKTNNFYQPEIATFPWNNLSDYWSYSINLSTSISLSLFILISLCIFYLFRRFKSQNNLLGNGF